MSTLEFYYDYGSPTTYLAWVQLPALLARTGATLVRKPILLGGVFKATGNASPVMVPAKGKYMMRDLSRFAARHGAPMRMNPHFPVNTLPLMRGAIWADREGLLDAYDAAMFRALWEQAENMGDPETIARVVAAAGLDPAAFAAAIETQEVKQALVAQTEEAISRGAFGAPTFFVGDELYFGQDRLDFVEAALAA